MINIKVYIYATVLAALVGFGFWVNHLAKTVDAQKLLISQQSAAIEASQNAIKQAAAAVEASNQDSIKHQQAIEAINNENETLRRDLASGSKQLHVRASCPGVPSTTTSTAGTTDPAPRFDAVAEQDYINLIDGIKKNKLSFDRCMADNALIRKMVGENNAGK